MHRPGDLLKSLIFLDQSESITESNLRRELRQWIEKLAVARDEGAAVAIHIRITNGVSGLEIDRLRGTY